MFRWRKMHMNQLACSSNKTYLVVSLTIGEISKNEQIIYTHTRNIFSLLEYRHETYSINRLSEKNSVVNSLPTTKFCAPSEILHMNKSKSREINSKQQHKTKIDISFGTKSLAFFRYMFCMCCELVCLFRIFCAVPLISTRFFFSA